MKLQLQEGWGWHGGWCHERSTLVHMEMSIEQSLAKRIYYTCTRLTFLVRRLESIQRLRKDMPTMILIRLGYWLLNEKRHSFFLNLVSLQSTLYTCKLFKMLLLPSSQIQSGIYSKLILNDG